MPVPNAGKGAGFTYHWRNTTKTGVINQGEVDYAPGGVFHGYQERRQVLQDPKYGSGQGFQWFRIGSLMPRIGPGKIWTDHAGGIKGMVDRPGRAQQTYICFPDTKEGQAEFDELLASDDSLRDVMFDDTFTDPRTEADGSHRKIRRFGFRDCRRFLEDISSKYEDINSGKVSAVDAHDAVREAPVLRATLNTQAEELSALRAKIAEYEGKVAGVAKPVEKKKSLDDLVSGAR